MILVAQILWKIITYGIILLAFLSWLPLFTSGSPNSAAGGLLWTLFAVVALVIDSKVARLKSRPKTPDGHNNPATGPSHTLTVAITIIAVLALAAFVGSIVVFIGARQDPSKVETKPMVQSEAGSQDSGPQEPVEITVEGLLAEVNRRRAEVAVSPLKADARLNASAQAKCEDMSLAMYFDHVNPSSGKHGYEYAKEALSHAPGYYSENLTRSLPQENEREIFDGWFESAPHREAALDERYTLTGFGFCGGRQVVEHFFSPSSYER